MRRAFLSEPTKRRVTANPRARLAQPIAAIRWGLVAALAVIVSSVAFMPNGAFMSNTARAESALDLISGFDIERLKQSYPVADSKSAGEMAKLLYRLRKADQARLASKSEADPDGWETGDAVSVSGTITAIRQYQVPESLVEFLELDRFQELVLTDENQTELSVFAPPISGSVSKGDTITADAIVLSSADSAPVFAAGRVGWMPVTPERIGWKLLSEAGVDLTVIADAAARNRRVLEAEDGEAFYALLAAAKDLDASGHEGAAPETVQPVDLLQHPTRFHGQWIRLRATTVRVTRVTVSDPVRQKQLGQDHYYQIDASGDLGKYVIRLQRGEDDPGEPIEMSGSYPVSFVAAKLPEFLQSQLDAENAVVSMISHPVSIDGFFYRLWSYTNEFMSREGGGKQVGPLIVVSDWRSLARPDQGDEGIEFIGYALAGGVFLAIIATIFWTRRNAKEDARVREQLRPETKIDL